MKHPYTRCFYFDQGSRSPVDVNNAVYLKHKKKLCNSFILEKKHSILHRAYFKTNSVTTAAHHTLLYVFQVVLKCSVVELPFFLGRVFSTSVFFQISPSPSPVIACCTLRLVTRVMTSKESEIGLLSCSQTVLFVVCLVCSYVLFCPCLLSAAWPYPSLSQQRGTEQ